ncbi:hypothetical protein [Methylobacterium sp. E-045]|uniref:hypothetical protein n=1 Tax=Methylobacterium sp. E-045 TaxID=2836575 RepID=UPI001FB9EE9E|nr:hypothetical protein [Methylobacterium sp. E-045]MCJ2127458.1 hypothetical protein [Methylobacterium sp. E-045]
MAIPLQTRGTSSAAYEASFQAIRSLWRETSAVVALVMVQGLVDAATSASRRPALASLELIVDVVVTVLLTPYTMAIYRHALGLPVGSLRRLLEDAVRRKDFLAYQLGWFLVGRLWTTIPITSFHGMVSVLLFILCCWLTLRLFAVGPALAIEESQATARGAFEATAGRVWTIVYICFCTAFPLVAAVLIAGVAVVLVVGSGTGKPAASSLILTGILLSPLVIFSLVLRAVLEAQIFRNLGLFAPQPEGEHR